MHQACVDQIWILSEISAFLMQISLFERLLSNLIIGKKSEGSYLLLANKIRADICLCVTHGENDFNNQNICNVVAIVEKLTLCDDVASLDIRPGLRKEVR